jgi:hypothetical protein
MSVVKEGRPGIDDLPTSSDTEWTILANEFLREFRKLRCRSSLNFRGTDDVTTKEIVFQKFTAMTEWRCNFAKLIEEAPSNVLSSQTILRLCLLKEPTQLMVEEIVTAENANILPSVTMQLQVLLKILVDTKFIEKLRNLECHNCLKVGHGAAVCCPFPKNSANCKVWMNRPENRKFKIKENQRRRRNCLAKKVQSQMESAEK